MKKIVTCTGLIAAVLFVRNAANALPPCDTDEPRQYQSVSVTSGYVGHHEKNTNALCSGGGYKTTAGWTAGPVPTPMVKNSPKRKANGWLNALAGLFAAPAYANHSATGEHNGYRDYNNQSGASGRNNACAARLDVCFGSGHQSLPASAPSSQDCVDFCDGNMPNPSPNNGANIACSITDCESRCNGWTSGTCN